MLSLLAFRGHSTVWRDATDHVIKQVNHAPAVRYSLSNDLDSMRALPPGFLYESIGPKKYRVIHRLKHSQTRYDGKDAASAACLTRGR